MKVVRVNDLGQGADDMQARLSAELAAGRRVLWLIGGGSNIPLMVKVLAGLPAANADSLTVTLTDERYGPVNHADSNWRQLGQAGFDFSRVRSAGVLDDKLPDMATTAAHFGASLKQLFSEHDVIIAQFGMGPDGHIAGILPGSPAASAAGWAAGYDAGNFQRLTMTFDAIRRVSAAWLIAGGPNKRPALEQLAQENLPLTQQPAQILKELPESYVFNDQIGDPA